MSQVAADAGYVDVLNCMEGHMKFSFDKNIPEEVEKAKKAIMEMMGRGYMIFVEEGGEQKRVKKFDPETDTYILEEPEPDPEITTEVKKGKRTGRRVPLKGAKATGIAPTAGG
jgi:hypothetical protein